MYIHNYKDPYTLQPYISQGPLLLLSPTSKVEYIQTCAFWHCARLSKTVRVLDVNSMIFLKTLLMVNSTDEFVVGHGFHSCLFTYQWLFGWQVCGVQGISGTGSLRLGMEFLKRFHCSDVVYLSKPTWSKFLWQSFFCSLENKKNSQGTYSTGHGHCSTYTPVNCVQYGRFPCKVHAKSLHVNFYRELLHAAFLHTNLRVFLHWLILLVIKTRKLRVFLYISKRQQPMMADVKLETVIVEKHLFAVKKKTTYYTCNVATFSYYKNVMFL